MSNGQGATMTTTIIRNRAGEETTREHKGIIEAVRYLDILAEQVAAGLAGQGMLAVIEGDDDTVRVVSGWTTVWTGQIL